MFSSTTPWGTAPKVSFVRALLSSFFESHKLWLTSILWEYFSRRFFFSYFPPGLYGLLNSAINYCFMTRWKVLLFVLSSDYFLDCGRQHESLFLPQRRRKWTLIKVRKRELEGGKFICYLPWHFSLPFEKEKSVRIKNFKITCVHAKNISCICKMLLIFFSFSFSVLCTRQRWELESMHSDQIL